MRWLLAILLLLLAVLQYRLWVGDGSLVEVWELHRRIEAQQAENARLLERNDALRAEVRDLKEGVEAIEERARHELGMVKQGETFFHIMDVPASDAQR
jgi:cell division protein FtsB